MKLGRRPRARQGLGGGRAAAKDLVTNKKGKKKRAFHHADDITREKGKKTEYCLSEKGPPYDRLGGLRKRGKGLPHLRRKIKNNTTTEERKRKRGGEAAFAHPSYGGRRPSRSCSRALVKKGAFGGGRRDRG